MLHTPGHWISHYLTLYHTWSFYNHTRGGLSNTTTVPPSRNALAFTAIATPFWQIWQWGWQYHTSFSIPETLVAALPWLCACRVQPLSVCPCLQCWGHGQQVPTTDSLSIKENTQQLKFTATTQSRGERPWLLALFSQSVQSQLQS